MIRLAEGQTIKDVHGRQGVITRVRVAPGMRITNEPHPVLDGSVTYTVDGAEGRFEVTHPNVREVL
jgi:hypothetical protein